MPSVNEATEYKDHLSETIDVPLTHLTFDERIADMVEERNFCFPVALLGNIQDCGSFKLDNERLDRILNNYGSEYDEPIPPIKIKKGFGTYIVVNGRHRVCAAILNNSTSIQCVIIDE